MKVLVKIYLTFFATKVGEDEYGNQFFELKRLDYLGRKKRYCLYKGVVEASKISPEWHPFMHYQIEAKDVKKHFREYKWQKPALPDTTLSAYKFLPKNHMLYNEDCDLYNSTGSKNPFKTKIWKPQE
jgi:NADH:ubiquinone oxidoreductase subunit